MLEEMSLSDEHTGLLAIDARDDVFKLQGSTLARDLRIECKKTKLSIYPMSTVWATTSIHLRDLKLLLEP